MWVKRIGLVLVYRSWVGVGCRSNRVVDHERRAVAKLHLAGGDDGLAFLDAGEDGHLVSTLQTGGNEDLPRDQLWAALRVLPLVIHHVDRLPVGIVGDGGLRKGEEALLAAGCDVDACIHSRQQEPVWNVCKRSEEHTSELQSHLNIVCRLLLEKKKHSR